MLKVTKLWMLRLTNPRNSQNKRWCAVLVLVAACALAVSVATRYTAATTKSAGAATTVRKEVSPKPGWQRLIKDAATWLPPVVAYVAPQQPSSHSLLADRDAAAPIFFPEPNLYNRPPPFLS